MNSQGHSQKHFWGKTNPEEATEERSLTLRNIMRRIRERKNMMIGRLCGTVWCGEILWGARL